MNNIHLIPSATSNPTYYRRKRPKTTVKFEAQDDVIVGDKGDTMKPGDWNAARNAGLGQIPATSAPEDARCKLNNAPRLPAGREDVNNS